VGYFLKFVFFFLILKMQIRIRIDY
jgi:hypothetical protein